MNRCFLLLCTILFLLICRQTAAESKPGLQDHHDKPDKEFREREERKNNQDEFREEFDNQQMRVYAETAMIVLAVVAFSVLAVGGFLLYKCVQRRNIAQNVRRQMELKSYEFMASLGGPQAFADPQMKHVIHI